MRKKIIKVSKKLTIESFLIMAKTIRYKNMQPKTVDQYVRTIFVFFIGLKIVKAAMKFNGNKNKN